MQIKQWSKVRTWLFMWSFLYKPLYKGSEIQVFKYDFLYDIWKLIDDKCYDLKCNKRNTMT